VGNPPGGAVGTEPVNATTARLVVPFGRDNERFTATVDSRDGLFRRMESLRYKGEGATSRTSWCNDVRKWGQLEGRPVPLVTAVRWGHESTSCAVLRTEDVIYNADLSANLQAKGP
jgi:hypothetical protein